jgi:arginyl-tRNA synthetase
MNHDAFLAEVLAALDQALAEMLSQAKITNASADEFAPTPTPPPQFDLGQAAIPCHPLAKMLRSAPPKIAQHLADAINGRKHRYIAKVDAVNGYLNFHCQFVAYAEQLLPEIRSGRYFTRKLLLPSQIEKIVVEYSQPNTHKALHVGHLRNMVYGDAVCNLLAFAGHEVVRATYPGDMGTHIAKTLWYLHERGADKKLPTENQADWLGHMYAEADEYVTNAEKKPEGAALKAQITAVLHDLQHRQGSYYPLYLTTREWSLAQMREIYQWLGIHFDVWYFESECDEPSRELVLRKFQEGFFVKSEGAIGIDLSAYNLGFALFLKSDGSGLYLTKDLELIRRKFEDPRVTRSIVVVDARQKLHFKQLFKTAELMGYPQAAKSEHLSYETVTTEDGKAFSSRSLTGMPLHQLREVMEKKVITDYLESFRGEWPDAEIQRTAGMVALGALKYGFLRVDGNGVIRFVLDEWLKLDGDTGPYLQYVHARCSSVIRKLGGAPADVTPVLETAIERELLFFLGGLDRVGLQAAHQSRPSVLAGYLYDLCKLFNRFYTECPIKTSSGAQRDTRLALVEATAAVLKKGLSLLGIPAPERM